MFKFDPKQVILDQSLRNDHTRWIAPYKEGSDDQKWVVKCIHVHKHEEINNILQNMFLQTSSNSVGLLPIMGYDVQKDELGQSKIYMRMPRLKESLRNIVDEYRNSFDSMIPIEKIVCYLYSVANTLDELAQKHIFHRNLKPTNVLVDSEGLVYLTDLKLNQYNMDINERNYRNEETPNAPDNNSKNNSSENNDLLYLAPELYNNYALPTEEDIYKADVWSLGMIIAEACLMNKLQFTPPEFPLQDQIDTADQNIAEIRDKYGGNLSKVMASILCVNPSERITFKEICENLEENFSNIVSSRENTELMKLSWKSKTNSKIFYSDYSIDEENDLGNPFLKEEEISHRHAFMLDLSQSKDNILDRSIDFNYENKQGFYQKAIRMKNRLKIKFSQVWEKPFKLKDVVRYFKVALTLTMLVLLVYTLSHRILEESRMKYMKAIRGLEMKYSDQFKLTLENFNSGALTIETSGGGGHHRTEYWNLPNSPWEFRRDAALDSLLRDLATQADLEDFVTSLTELRIVLTEPLKITDRTFDHLQIALLKFKSLKGFSFQKIEGEITDLGVNSFMAFLTKNFKDLESLSIGFTKGGGPDEHERDSSLSIDGLYPFANQVLKDFKKLTSYTITFERMDIVTDVLLKQLGTHLNEYGENLKFFDLKTSGCTKITSEGLKHFNAVFLNSLFNVVRLGLNYKGTNIDSEGLNQLVTSVCEKAKSIDTFGFSVENTDINAEDFSSVVTILKQNRPKTLKRLLIQTSIWERDFPTKLHEQLNFIPEVLILP